MCRILSALGAKSKELKVMAFDCKTGLRGDKLLQDRKIAISKLHRLGAGSADKHMAVPGRRRDEPMLAALIVDPFQVPQILQCFDGTGHGRLIFLAVLSFSRNSCCQQPARTFRSDHTQDNTWRPIRSATAEPLSLSSHATAMFPPELSAAKKTQREEQ
jgi:hypothetical protein